MHPPLTPTERACPQPNLFPEKRCWECGSCGERSHALVRQKSHRESGVFGIASQMGLNWSRSPDATTCRGRTLLTKRSFDAHGEAAAALLASSATSELSEIGRIAMRLAKVVTRLEKFSFPLVAAPLAGLLTRRENHTASGRIEALIHLAATACQGEKAPQQRHLREWLNVAVYNDVITELEMSVEDVFVSNVDAWFGNARLFGGHWVNNAEYVHACLDTLTRIADRTWAAQSLKQVEALLRVSEAVAERAGIARYCRTESRPRKKIAVGVSILAESKANVGFSDNELGAIGVVPGILNPFIFQGEHAELLAEQSLGHSELERRPLVRWKGRTWVVLPTAIGAAIRRFVLERGDGGGGSATVSIDMALGAV